MTAYEIWYLIANIFREILNFQLEWNMYVHMYIFLNVTNYQSYSIFIAVLSNVY